jgi:hypothetical protein
MNTQIMKIDGESYQYNEANNTLYFDDSWLLVEENDSGDKFVITTAGNTFYLD